MKLLICALSAISFLTGCASFKKNKTLLYGAASFAACSVSGALTAPKEEKSIMHGALYGSSCAAGAMALTEIFLDEKTHFKKPLSQTEKKEINELEIRNSIIGSRAFKNMDQRLREKIQGEWNTYKIDNWILQGEKLIHEDMEIEFKKGETR